VKKMPTGIDGFDEMTDGGLPRGRTVLVLAEIDARSKALTCELEAHRADLAVLSREEQARLRGEVQHDRELHRRRHVEGKSATVPRSRQ
jgi:hypothetical protein